MQEEVPESKNLQIRFNVNIRRQARQKMMRDRRNFQMFDSQPIQQIVKIWALPSNLEKVTVNFIVGYRYQELLHIPFKYKNNKIQSEQSEDECALRGFDDHLVFWSFFLQQMFLNKEIFSMTILEFLEDLVKKYEYKQLTVCRPLQCKIINVLELSVRTAFSTKGYRQILLHWVAGPEGINIIYQSIFSTFLPVKQYPSVYEVMKNTLSMKRKSETDIVCLIIKEMMRTADGDDVYQIYEQCPDLALKLMEEGVRYVEDGDISNIVDSLMFLIDSFAQVKIDYMKEGLGYLATRMIISRNQINIAKAFELLCWVTESSKQIIQYLVNDRQLCDAGLWKDIIESGQFLIHRNLNIKKQAFIFLRNVLCFGQYEQLVFITSNFNAHYADNFLHFIQLGLQQQNDSIILEALLQMLSIIFFYGENHRSQDDQNLPLLMCIQMNMGKDLVRVADNPNQSVRERAQEILKALEVSQFKQQSHFE